MKITKRAVLAMAAGVAVLGLALAGCGSGPPLSAACQRAVAAENAHVREALARYPSAVAAVDQGNVYVVQARLTASVSRLCPRTVRFRYLVPGSWPAG
jgi:hypothetical protein